MDGKKHIGIDVHQESISIAVSKDAGSDGDHHVECRAVDAVSARIVSSGKSGRYSTNALGQP
jgi:hypothetical protein